MQARPAGLSAEGGHRAERRPAPSLADLRIKLAAAVAFAARRLWRRDDLAVEDQVVLKHLFCALEELGRLYRPPAGATARAALALAPSDVVSMVNSLQRLAERQVPGERDVVAKIDEAAGKVQKEIDGHGHHN